MNYSISKRPRRLRKSESVRSLNRERLIRADRFVAPIFIVEGSNVKEPIPSMPDYYRYSLDLAVKEVGELSDLGVMWVLLFVKVPDHLKDNAGTEALNDDGLMQRAIRAIKSNHPGVTVLTDVALDPYSSYGHDGIVNNFTIDNDATLDVLAKMSVSHARAGADFVAPSDMMDGRVGVIRKVLDENNLIDTGIVAYSAKYASCFYGPFREALDSAPGFGDKKTYQMDPANRREAHREIQLDLDEGADMILIKPALAYLDIISDASQISDVPVVAYQVSGEYAMIKAASQLGWLDEKSAVIESLTAINRAGADIIVTYFAKEVAKWQLSNNG